MKVKVSQVVAVVESLKKLGGLDSLSAKQAYRCAKMLRKAQAAFDDFEKGRVKSAAKHGKQNGQNYEVPPENVEAFNKDIGDLLMEDVDLECEPIEIDGNAKGLTPHDFNALEPFVTVKE